ncbi:hypothetical protein NHJ13051_002661 [Beauveria bassiana]
MQLLSTLLTLSLSGFVIAAPVVTSEVVGNDIPALGNDIPALTVGDFTNSQADVAISFEKRPYVEGSIIFPDK